LTVPDADSLCRFIRLQDWNPEEQRPKNSLFKARDQKLSLFHVDRVANITFDGKGLKALCLGPFEGAGRAILSASVYREEAKRCEVEVDAEVYFRPDDVEPLWREWREAHVNVETTKCGKQFPGAYRAQLLSRLTSNNVDPPDEP